MTIAIDGDDMDAVRRRLARAADAMAGAVPSPPGGAAFGAAVLAGAVASFDAVVRGDANELRGRWRKLDDGVRDTFRDLGDADAGAGATLAEIRRFLE